MWCLKGGSFYRISVRVKHTEPSERQGRTEVQATWSSLSLKLGAQTTISQVHLRASSLIFPQYLHQHIIPRVKGNSTESLKTLKCSTNVLSYEMRLVRLGNSLLPHKCFSLCPPPLEIPVILKMALDATVH